VKEIIKCALTLPGNDPESEAMLLIPRTYTFNRPVALLLALPLLALLGLLVVGLANEFNFLALVMGLFTLATLLVIVVMGFSRRVRITPEGVHWLALRQRWTLPRGEIRHFGVLKYRSFRFIYLSTAVETPFVDPESPVSADAQTVFFQYRKGAWDYVLAWVRATHPRLQQEDLVRR
jgi:hypothetical protein